MCSAYPELFSKVRVTLIARSGGMKIIGEPKGIERTERVLGQLLELAKNGKTIIMSTHIFSLAESLCDEIGVLVDGTIVASGSAGELCALTGKDTFEEAFFALYEANHKEGAANAQ